MKTHFTKLIKLTFIISLFISITSQVTAQTWNWNDPTLSWYTRPSNYPVLTFSPNTGNVNNGTGTTNTITFNPYFAWTTFDFNPASTVTFPFVAGSTTVYNKTLTFSLSNNSYANSNLAGKYLGVQIYNGTTSSSNDLSVIILIPAVGQTPTETFSIDFSNLFTPTQVTKVRFTILDAKQGGSSPSNTYGSITIGNISFGTGTPGSSTVTNEQASQEWTLTTSDALYNANKGNVLVGNFSSLGFNSPLLNPYYQFVVNGRTNIIGNDNALNLFSSNLPATGLRHYLAFANSQWTSGPSTGTEYSVIGAGEYGNSTYNPKHLILQTSSLGGNVGIGSFTQAPKAKLHVNGTVLIGTSNYLQPTNWQVKPNNYMLAVEGFIVSQKSIVTCAANWSDFVFKPSYKLPSLRQQEDFIKENGHLKDVPSEEEVKQGGYDLSEMDAKFLQKLEELYLYTIELNKVVEEQKAEIDALKKELKKK